MPTAPFDCGRKTCGPCRQLIQITVLAAAAHNVDTGIYFSRQRGQLPNSARISGGQAGIYTLHQLADGLRHRLSGLYAKLLHRIGHTLRCKEAAVIDVNPGRKIRTFARLRLQLRITPLPLCRRRFF